MITTNQNLPTIWRPALVMLCICAVAGTCSRRVHADDADFLKQHGIECSPKSIAVFFDSLNPKGDALTRTQALVAQLGSDDFKTREDAMTALIRTPQLPLEIVKAAAKGDDPEVRWRSEIVLKQAGNQSRRLLQAALGAIAEKEIKGLAPGLMSCTEYYDDASIRRRAQRALLATATPADVELLRKSTKSPEMHTRILALRALAHVQGDEATADLRPFLDDRADTVRLFAAFELASRGNRDVLPTLSKLLRSSETRVRSRSVQLLRTITGQKFSYVAYGSEKKRDIAAKAWQTWIDSNADSAKLNLNVTLAPARVGRILVCYYSSNLVVEYDLEHKVVWNTTVPQPWGCHGLSNGHRLIASYGSNAVIEYDQDGMEVWRATTTSNPSHAQRLENGNTLISLYSQRKVIEITPENKIVNTLKVPGQPNHVERTPDGHTVVACSNGVMEYNDKGEQIRKISSGRPFSARRLENGNILLADTTQTAIREIGPDDEVVWTKTGLGNPLDAFRLENGNTLVAHQTGITEYDPDGKSVWTDSRGYAIRISYY